MPGYDLSIAAAEIAEANPEAEGLWLVSHGLFTFGETARQSYDRMIEFVNRAERHLASRGVAILPTDERPQEQRFIDLLKERLQAAGPVFAGGTAIDARTGPTIETFLGHPDLADLATRGTVTPDHVIRVKPFPLLLDGTEGAEAIDRALKDYSTHYEAYFRAGAAEAKEPKTMLDCLPRVAQIENIGMVGIGKTAREAKIVADLTSQSMRVMLAAESYGRFTPLTPGDLFDMGYWALEQAKLGK